jgi:hypothetical protein
MLDLSPKSAVKLGGLLLPNVFITNSDSLPTSLIGSFSLAEQDYFPALQGMIVYNSNPDLSGGTGLFVWNGSDWKRTGAVTCTVVYKNSPNGTAAGKTNSTALKAEIYAIYNDGTTGGGTDRKLKLTAQVKDCPCCGAYTVDGGWLTFMCYNLGASSAYVTPAQQIAAMETSPNSVMGSIYQWGKKKAWSNNGTVSGWSDQATTGATSAGYNADDSAWGYGTVKNTTYDPCPDGFRVPSPEQWLSICGVSQLNMIAEDNPIPTLSGNVWYLRKNGDQIGDHLFLPNIPFRRGSDGSIYTIPDMLIRII